ncbi:MAG: hypothetical protein ACE5GE_17105 [Phycisphaerae bacterium]
MSHILAQLAQDLDNGRGWGGLLYLLILIVLPIVNAIKDRYVERVAGNKKKPIAGADPQSRRTPRLRPVEPNLPTAKPLRPPGPRPPTGPTRAPRLRPVQPPAKTDQDAPIAIPIPPFAKAPRPPVRPARPARPPAKASPEARARAAKLAHARMIEQHSVGGIHTSEVAPNIDLHAADPTVKVHDVDPDVHVGDLGIGVNVHELTDLAVPDLLPRGRQLVMGRLTAARMREAIILNEVLGQPVGLRDPMKPPGRNL